VVPAAHAADPERRQRLAREAHITAMLDHPGIVPVYDIDLGPDGRLYFSMRLIVGRSLAVALAGAGGEGIASLQAQLSVISGVADALAYAHKKCVVHSDITPANIMIGTFGEVIVVDWGSATLIEGAAGAISDTASVSPRAPDVRYLSPEQARGESVTPASDQYALACVAFHLLIGRPALCPTTGEGADEKLMARKRRGEIDEPDAGELAKLPKGLWPVLRKALAQAPGARHASMAEFGAALEPFMTSHGHGHGHAHAHGSAISRHPVALIALILWLLSIGAAVAWSAGLIG
jgi:eukaryotic-like serine/threonine-protein kinase